MPAQIGLIGRFLGDVFGKNDKMFMTVNVREFLFDGLPVCKAPSGLASVVCNVIKGKSIKAMRDSPDGSLLFSLFHHVSVGRC